MTVETIELAAGYRISRLIKGGWQLHERAGAIDPAQAIADMEAYADAGITTFETADTYDGVDELIGAFLRRTSRRDAIKVHTRVSLNRATSARNVADVIERSLRRLGLQRLDLVQLSSWAGEAPGVVDAALELVKLQRAGKIDQIGVTNFDLPRLEAVGAAGVTPVSNQVQYSLVDDRPEHGVAAYCRNAGIQLLAYGPMVGGFLTERWLDQPDPGPGERPRPRPEPFSAIYRAMIEEFGGWLLFQELLHALKKIADRHGVGIDEIAVRHVLDRADVAAVLVGGASARHLAKTARVFSFGLTPDDRSTIAAILSRRIGPAGDVAALERDPASRLARALAG